MIAIDTIVSIKSGDEYGGKYTGKLGTCLRMLFAEKLQPAVQTVLNEKGKIEFHISIAADQEVFEELNERYKIMIS